MPELPFLALFVPYEEQRQCNSVASKSGTLVLLLFNNKNEPLLGGFMYSLGVPLSCEPLCLVYSFHDLTGEGLQGVAGGTQRRAIRSFAIAGMVH